MALAIMPVATYRLRKGFGCAELIEDDEGVGVPGVGWFRPVPRHEAVRLPDAGNDPLGQNLALHLHLSGIQLPATDNREHRRLLVGEQKTTSSRVTAAYAWSGASSA